MTRILLADDHPMILTALEALLRETDFAIASTASSCGEALEASERSDWDVLMLDLKMPDGSGMEVLRRLHQRGDRRPVVLVTAGIDDPELAEALVLGAAGLFLKNSDPALLLSCLEAVAGGGRWIDPELQPAAEALDKRRPRKPLLSPRERELVALVRKGLRNREIAEQLGVTEGTVKVYLHGIFDKVGVASRTELAIRAGEFLG